MKFCTGCDQTKSLSEFYKDKSTKTGYVSRCKDCRKSYISGYRESNTDKIKTYGRLYNQKNAEVLRVKARKHHLKRKYNLTLEQWEEILAAQGYKCAACERPYEESSQFHTDHDHACCETQYSCGACIRGLLCHRCNQALGLMQENHQAILNLANYVKKASPATSGN